MDFFDLHVEDLKVLTNTSCTVKIPIIGHAKYINYFMQVLQV